MSIFNKNQSLSKFKMTSDNFFNQNNKKFDFVYVDGDHSKDQVLKDLKILGLS